MYSLLFHHPNRVDTHAPVITLVDVIYPLLLTSRLSSMPTFVSSIPHLNLAWV